MKRRFGFLLVAVMLMMSACLPAGASDLGGSDLYTLRMTSHLDERDVELPLDNDMATISTDATMTSMITSYQTLTGSMTRSDVLDIAMYGPDSFRLSALTLQIDNLSDFQSMWHASSGSRKSPHIRLSGIQASATFDLDAQAAVRNAAVLKAASPLMTWFVRSAFAAVTGRSGAYPSSPIVIGVAVESLDEMAITPEVEAVVLTYQDKVVGGACVKTDVNGSEVTNLGVGYVLVETPVSVPAGATAADLKAVYVKSNGQTAVMPVQSLKNGKAAFNANNLGNYLIIYDPNHVVPATGDQQPVQLWGMLLALSGFGLAGLTVYRRKRSA